MLKRGRSIILGVVLMLWSVGIVYGLKWLHDYANAAGQTGRITQSWPAASHIKCDESGHKATLVLFLHPECACSRATVGELDELMAKTGGKADVHAVFVQPEGWSRERTQGDLWKSAAAIPGVHAYFDQDAREAKLFGAMTSGQVFAYDARGSLAFSGGITFARGHRGDNLGLQAVANLVNSGQASVSRTRVFGCSLFSPHPSHHLAHHQMAASQ
jgi:hypothetical protein